MNGDEQEQKITLPDVTK